MGEIAPLTVADLRAASLAVNSPPMTNDAVLAAKYRRLAERVHAGAKLVLEGPPDDHHHH